MSRQPGEPLQCPDSTAPFVSGSNSSFRHIRPTETEASCKASAVPLLHTNISLLLIMFITLSILFVHLFHNLWICPFCFVHFEFTLLFLLIGPNRNHPILQKVSEKVIKSKIKSLKGVLYLKVAISGKESGIAQQKNNIHCQAGVS